jgi:hypothetical protein
MHVDRAVIAYCTVHCNKATDKQTTNKSSARLQATGNGRTITVRPFTRNTLQDRPYQRSILVGYVDKIRRVG